jgi:hypothetical protein
MAQLREIRDPIHGFIERTPTEENIINTAVFQRLRGIRQLAMASLVYPGALHTRFEHSIGVMHIAKKLAANRNFEIEEETKKLIGLAALLHDIGHGPFSHVSEAILKKYHSSKIKENKIHELITCNIIDQNYEISKLTSPIERRKIIDLLSGTGGESIVRNIISGPLDADKQDYLLRDSYFCGVKYGIYDIDRLIGVLEACEWKGDKVLAIADEGIHVIEQFIMAKYHMTTQVLLHKIRLITDAMIVRALELGIEVDGIPWLNRLFRYNGTSKYIQNYIEWDDSRLMNSILYSGKKHGEAAKLFLMLKNRVLFKTVCKLNLSKNSKENDIENPDVRFQLLSIESEKNLKANIENDIAEYLSSKTGENIKKNHVILKQFSFKSVRKLSGDDDEGSIKVKMKKGTENFEDVSTLFRSINAKEEDQFLQVYAPVSYIDETQKRKRSEEFNDEIYKIITSNAMNSLKYYKGEQNDSRETNSSHP